ncbi:hypothetical protein DFH07DRAFT_784179 [Mycena maculata]|uniref:Uncharacterized protein n=1 Tax=Mycena maculata TaxID=230809 RepID=A0AAD7HFT9_9AGAR|nr:hypothetical protein DFH07DRAFT_784565 [Mycena maculata]KAJ7721261.1 hypothetical protein DFH07DRAFT_784179 [Mycena maculata]
MSRKHYHIYFTPTSRGLLWIITRYDGCKSTACYCCPRPVPDSVLSKLICVPATSCAILQDDNLGPSTLQVHVTPATPLCIESTLPLSVRSKSATVVSQILFQILHHSSPSSKTPAVVKQVPHSTSACLGAALIQAPSVSHSLPVLLAYIATLNVYFRSLLYLDTYYIVSLKIFEKGLGQL